MTLLMSELVNLPQLPGAACKGQTEHEPFYPRQGCGGRDNPGVRDALALCATCPAVVACLTWAVEPDERGIWGGTTERERRAAKRGAVA